jgi:hypothetical protein
MDGTMGRKGWDWGGVGSWVEGEKFTRMVFKWSPKLLIVDEEDGVLEVIWKSFLLSYRIGIDIFNDLLVSGNVKIQTGIFEIFYCTGEGFGVGI